MRAKAFFIMVVLSCFMAVPGAAAQEQEPPKTDTARFGNPTGTARGLQNYIYGVVKKIGKVELVLDKTEFGDAQPFKLEPKTKYVHDGKPSKLGNLKVGDQVFVQIKKDKKTGDMIATKVMTGVQPAKLP
jgi:hypothetical protein